MAQNTTVNIANHVITDATSTALPSDYITSPLQSGVAQFFANVENEGLYNQAYDATLFANDQLEQKHTEMKKIKKLSSRHIGSAQARVTKYEYSAGKYSFYAATLQLTLLVVALLCLLAASFRSYTG